MTRLERSMKAFYDTMAGALASLTADAPRPCEPGRDPRDVYVSILGALVVYFFRDPIVKELFGREPLHRRGPNAAQSTHRRPTRLALVSESPVDPVGRAQ